VIVQTFARLIRQASVFFLGPAAPPFVERLLLDVFGQVFFAAG